MHEIIEEGQQQICEDQPEFEALVQDLLAKQKEEFELKRGGESTIIS